MKKYQFNIYFGSADKVERYHTVLTIPAKEIDDNEFNDLDDLIGETAIKRAILNTISIHYQDNIRQIENVVEIIVTVKFGSRHEEKIGLRILTNTWQRLKDRERWDYIVAGVLKSIVWQVETTLIEE